MINILSLAFLRLARQCLKFLLHFCACFVILGLECFVYAQTIAPKDSKPVATSLPNTWSIDVVPMKSPQSKLEANNRAKNGAVGTSREMTSKAKGRAPQGRTQDESELTITLPSEMRLNDRVESSKNGDTTADAKASMVPEAGGLPDERGQGNQGKSSAGSHIESRPPGQAETVERNYPPTFVSPNSIETKQIENVIPKTATDTVNPNEGAIQKPIQSYCVNVANAAVDARYLRQKTQIEALSAEVKNRIELLEKK